MVPWLYSRTLLFIHPIYNSLKCQICWGGSCLFQLYWSMVDLKSSVSFKYTARESCIHMLPIPFQILFPFRSLQSIE